MANDDCPSHKVKDDENTKSKKKNSSPASASGSTDASGLRRSGRETSSSKQTTTSPSSTRKSERIEKRTPPNTPPTKKKDERNEKEMGASPLRRSDRGKKDLSPGSSDPKKFVEVNTSSNTKSDIEKNASSLKQSALAASKDGKREMQDLDDSGSQRKRITARDFKAFFKLQRIRIEADENKDLERLTSPDANTSNNGGTASNYGVGKELKRRDKWPQLDNNKSGCSVEDGDDGVDKCSGRVDEKGTEGIHVDSQTGGKRSSLKRKMLTGNIEHDVCANSEDNHISQRSRSSGCKKHDYDETCLTCSKKQRINHDLESQQELDSYDQTCNKDVDDISSSKVRGACKASDAMENAENSYPTALLRKETRSDNGRDSDGGMCTSCKLGGQLRCCDAVGCNRFYHLSCLDPPVDNIPSGIWCCPVCVKSVELSLPSVSRVAESIWDTREVVLSDDKGLHNRKQKQYFVKYEGLAHIHNQWVNEEQLLNDAPLLVENFSKQDSMMNKGWTVPHQLLKKRLILSFKPQNENQDSAGKVLKYHYEWLVKWQGLDNGHATWELESSSVLDSPTGQNIINEYETHRGKTKTSASPVDKTKELSVRFPTIPGCPLGMDNIHLSYVKKLHDSWTKGQSRVIFDYQERVMRVVLFILSLKDVTQPFLIITTSNSLSQWEDTFLLVAPFNDLKVSIEDREFQRSVRLLEVQKGDGQLVFQVLLYPVDAFVKDLHVLKNIIWEATIVDESQCSQISTQFNHIKSLSTDNRLLLFSDPLGESMAEYRNVLSLLGCDGALSNEIKSQTEWDDSLRKLKETLSRCIAYECKFVEFWVPVQISNVQLEQYCATISSNAIVLSSCSKTKSDAVEALHDILMSNRKCCSHPYTADPSLQSLIMKDVEPTMMFNVGIKASGKLQFLDLMLPEVKKRQLRVLILFQSTGGTGKGLTTGDILDDFVNDRFGQDSYERVDGSGMDPIKKQAAFNRFNNDMNRFIFLQEVEHRARHQNVKLSSVDIILLFDSDLNPASDLRALQKISIDSQSEQIMIFRLYSSCTLEEKILRLAEQKVPLDSKLQNLSRSTCDQLLIWGASDLFKKLKEFHDASNQNITSGKAFLKEVMEEFKYLISHKGKSTDTAKPIINRVQQSCGTYGKTPSLHSELKTQLPDGEQPHIFWRKLLTGMDRRWKFVSVSTPRQRKRPQYFEDSTSAGDADVGKKRKKSMNNSIEPAAKPVIEGETGANKGASGGPAHYGSQSPDDPFWSTSAPNEKSNEKSLHHVLKPTVSKLCKLLKFTEDVKVTVDRFLEYVLGHYCVTKEPTSTLQAFMISLCWIGSSLSKYKIDRRESFALATKHLDFSCKEEEANSVYTKLELAKEAFLSYTENQKKAEASKDCMPVPQGTSVDSTDPRRPHSVNSQGVQFEGLEDQHNQDLDIEGSFLECGQSDNHVASNDETLPNRCKRENLDEKYPKEIQKFFIEWDRRRVDLESDYRVDKALICTLHSNPSHRAEKLKVLEIEFANKLEEHERMKDIQLKKLKAMKLVEEGLMADNHSSSFREGRANKNQRVRSVDSPKTTPTSSVSPMEVQSRNKDGLEKPIILALPANANVTVPNVMEGDSSRAEMSISLKDWAVKYQLDLRNAEPQGSSTGSKLEGEGDNKSAISGFEEPNRVENPSDGANKIESTNSHTSEKGDETGYVDAVETRVPSLDSNKDNAKEGAISPDDVVVHVDSAGMGVPAGSCNNENTKEGAMGPDASHAMEDRNEIGPNDVVMHADSAGTGVRAVSCNKENAEDTTINPAATNTSEDCNESDPDDVAVHVDSAGMGVPSVTSNKENAKEDHNESGPNDVAVHVDSAGTGVPAVNCSKENAKEGTICPDAPNASEDRDEFCPNDVAVHLDSGGTRAPVANCNKENAEDITIDPDTSHVVEDPSQSCGSSSSNSPSAAASQEIAPTVQPVASPASDHAVLTIPEIQNESLQPPQLPLGRIQDRVRQANPSSSAELDVDDTQPIRNEPLQIQQLPHNEIQGKVGQTNPSSSVEVDVSNLQPLEAEQVSRINPENSSLEPHDEPPFLLSTNHPAAENQSDIPPTSGLLLETTGEVCTQSPQNHAKQVLHQATLAQNSEAPPLGAEIPNQDALQTGPNPLEAPRSDNNNQVASRTPNQHLGDPLQLELESLCASKDEFVKTHEEKKLRLKSECEKEIEEMIAQITRKYEAKLRDEEAEFNLKKKELDINLNRVVMNKFLAEAFRSKCQDLAPSGHAGTQQATQAGLMQQLQRFSTLPSTRRPTAPPLSSPAHSPTTHHHPPPLQRVHQPSALFSTPPTSTRPPPPTTPRPPPTINPITPSPTPTRPPSINPITPTTRSPAPHLRPLVTTEIRSPAPHLRPLVTTEIRSPAPHLRPLVTTEIRSPAPHLRPFRPSTSTSPPASLQRLHPLTSQPSPLPPFPPSLPPAQTPPLTTVRPPFLPLNSLPPMPTTNTALFMPESGGPPPLPTPDNLSDLLMDIDTRRHQQHNNLLHPPTSSSIDLSEFIRDGSAHSPSGRDLVCLSDDD